MGQLIGGKLLGLLDTVRPILGYVIAIAIILKWSGTSPATENLVDVGIHGHSQCGYSHFRLDYGGNPCAGGTTGWGCVSIKGR